MAQRWHDKNRSRSQRSTPALRNEFWKSVRVTGTGAELNQQLENAGRLADFLEFAELMAEDAHHRNGSCGGGMGSEPELHKEPLKSENVHLTVRSYK